MILNELEQIHNLSKAHKIQMTDHALKRCEIIEHYPQSARLPSCLICGQSLKQMPLHNVTGYDEEYLYAV